MDAFKLKRILVLFFVVMAISFVLVGEVFAQSTNLNLPGLSLNFGKDVDLVVYGDYPGSSYFGTLYLFYSNHCCLGVYETGHWYPKYAS